MNKKSSFIVKFKFQLNIKIMCNYVYALNISQIKLFFQTSTTAVLAYVRMAGPALMVSTHTSAPVLQGTLARTAIQVNICISFAVNLSATFIVVISSKL